MRKINFAGKRAPATRFCGAKSARWKAPGTTARRSIVPSAPGPSWLLRRGHDRDAGRARALTDQVDANFNVKEKPTGNIMLGAGFSSAEKVILSGIQPSRTCLAPAARWLQDEHQQDQQDIALSFTNPYWTIDGSAAVGTSISVTSIPPRFRWPPTSRRPSVPDCASDTRSPRMTGSTSAWPSIRRSIKVYDTSPALPRQFRQYLRRHGPQPGGDGRLGARTSGDSFLYPDPAASAGVRWKWPTPAPDMHPCAAATSTTTTGSRSMAVTR